MADVAGAGITREAAPPHPWASACPAELTSETRYRLLLEIAHRTRGTLDLDRILNHLLDSIADHLDFDAAGIFVLRDALAGSRAGSIGDLIAGVALRGFRSPVPRSDPMLIEGKGIVGHVIRTGRPLVARDVRLDPYYIEGRHGTLSEIAVPIRRDGLVIGALNLESDRIAAFDDRCLEVLAFYADAAAIAVEKAMLHEQRLASLRIEEQMRIAQEVQARLLPAAAPRVPGYEIAGLSIPSSRVGGDYFDFIPRPDGSLTLAVGDVAGHGIPAALLMSALRTLVRTHVRFGASLVRLAKTLNRQVPESMAGSAFVTTVIGALTPEDGAFSYVNCGHPPPLLVRSGGSVERLESGGPLLGVLEDARFEPGRVRLGPGDVLVLHTDGIVEVNDGNGRWHEAGHLAARVARARSRPAEEIIRGVVGSARRVRGPRAFEDDVTLVVLKRLG